MKKQLLLFVFALAATIVQAQNGEMYSLLYQDTVGGDARINFMQQRDGDFIADLFVLEYIGNYNYVPLGSMYYKISHNTFTVTDTLFVADTTPYYCLIRDPLGEGNIRAKLEYREDCDSTFFRICRFPDDDLHINPDEDIVTPLCEGYAYGGVNVHADRWGDLTIRYGKRNVSGSDYYLARFGSDGTLKHQALWLENNMYGDNGMGVLKESPLTYYLWTHDDSFQENLFVYTIDSLFHKNTVVINYILKEEVLDPYHTAYEYFDYYGDTQVIPADGGDNVLVAARYRSDTNFFNPTEYGVVVAKYDLRTTQLKDYIVFNDFPGGNPGQARCVGFKQMSDGTVYLMYKESGYPNESVIIVKMDTDLNVEWKRFCKTDNIIVGNWLPYSILFEDGQGEEKGIAWMGGARMAGNNYYGSFFFFLNHEGPVGLEKYGMEVRPYCFYPNPARDHIRFQYSPDVQPKQIELHDLQGRQVHTQNGNFESIDLSRLPAGVYTLRVTMEDGSVYSDKIVKE